MNGNWNERTRRRSSREASRATDVTVCRIVGALYISAFADSF
jgi:hypothetical protein